MVCPVMVSVISITLCFFLFVFSIAVVCFRIYINLNRFGDLLKCYLCKELDVTPPIYEYIIVGSGTSGSLIASRLALEKDYNILVLEAGPHGGILTNIPAIGPLLQKSAVDWAYRTTPQQNSCLALENHASNWPMGKLVGGTNKCNNMIYARGHPDDYKNLFPDSEYDYNRDVLPYFKRSEAHAGRFKNDSKFHSIFGDVPVQDLLYVTPLANATLEAAKCLGYDVTDLNGNQRIGFMQSQVHIQNGRRWTTSDALASHNHPNVRLQTNSLVIKVLLRSNYEAYGVKYTYLGEERTARARHGVILSAGVIGTPKILMQSGIGPKKHLDDVGIVPKIDLPVGNNLQDHVTTGLDLITLEKRLPIGVITMMSPKSLWDYYVNGVGPWLTNGCEVIALLDTESFKNDSLPDLELMVIPSGASSDAGHHYRKVFGLTDKVWTDYFVDLYGLQTISILPIVVRPKSRGTVRLAGKDPTDPPLINPNYLSHPDDVRVIIKGIEVVKRLIETKPMQELGARLNRKPFPGCESIEFDTNAYWECYARHLTMTSYHPVGTCKMGSKLHEETVVDYDFKVLHSDKLFVADGSVFPNIPGVNINAPIMMLAEKAADAIKNIASMRRATSRRRHIFLRKMHCDFVDKVY